MNKFILAFTLWAIAFSAHATDIKEVTSNGVKAWVVEDRLLPIVAIEIAFKNAGSAHDPVGKNGLGFEVASMLNEGAGKFDSQEYQTLLEENAIGFQPDLDKDNFYISIKSLSENLPLAVDLTNLAITKPQFNENDLLRIKGQTYTIIKKKGESASDAAEKELSNIIFKNHPYSNIKEGTAKSIGALTARDLHDFTKQKFAKDNIIISIVGDVGEAEAKDIIAKLTKNLPQKSATTELPEIAAYPKGRMVKLRMDNPQTYVLFGIKGLKRSDQDYYAAYILNHILGGGTFSSRLMKEVREKNGLAYTVGTQLKTYNKADLLIGMVSTKNESVAKSIDIISREFTRIAKKGVSARELKDAKDYIVGSFGLNLDTNEALAGFLISMQVHNLGIDYLNKRNDYFKSVTLDQINDVSERLITPENLVFVRVGR